MIVSFNKFVTQMLDNKEYSSGLRLKISDITVKELPKYTRIIYKFDLINEGDQPYDLYVVIENIRHEISELSKYMSFDKFNEDIEIEVDIVQDDVIYFSNEFKKLLYEKVLSITHIKFDEDRVYNGKFLPRIELITEHHNILVKFHFRINDVSAKEKEWLQDEIEDKLYFDLELGDILKNKVQETMNNWSRNFFLDDPEFHYDLPDETWGVGIKLV